MMLILVTYDISTVDSAGQKRLRNVAKKCLDFGQRVQNSVFECWLDNANFVKLRCELLEIVDLESDSLRFYFLGENWQYKVEHHGARQSLNLQDPLIL